MFYRRNDIAQIVVKALQGLRGADAKPLFKSVTRAAISNTYHLAKLTDAPSHMPAAIVVVGNSSPNDPQTLRTLDIMIAVYTEFRAKTSDEVTDICALSDAVERLFNMFAAENSAPTPFLLSDGSKIEWTRTELIESESRTAAIGIFLKMTEPQKVQPSTPERA